jgi:hypothetical protein
MPINWTTSPLPPFPPSKEKALEIIKQRIDQAKLIAQDIINYSTPQIYDQRKRFLS